MKLFFDKDAGDGKVGGPGGQAVDRLKVGDKEYSAEDVNGILTELGGLKAHEQTISQLGNMAKSFDMEIGDFAQQGLAALRVVNELIDGGVIDENGKAVEKKPDPKPKEGEGKGKDKDLNDLFNLDDKGEDDKGGEKGKKMSTQLTETLERLMEPITKTVGDLTDRVKRSEEVQTGILEQDFTNKLVTKFPNLTPADTKTIFATARGDRSKSLMDHAEEFSKAKVEQVVAIQKEFAEKHGLNFEQLNENLIKEQEAKDGAPPAKEGTKITFRKGVKGGVTPGELAGGYLAHKISR